MSCLRLLTKQLIVLTIGFGNSAVEVELSVTHRSIKGNFFSNDQKISISLLADLACTSGLPSAKIGSSISFSYRFYDKFPYSQELWRYDWSRTLFCSSYHFDEGIYWLIACQIGKVKWFECTSPIGRGTFLPKSISSYSDKDTFCRLDRLYPFHHGLYLYFSYLYFILRKVLFADLTVCTLFHHNVFLPSPPVI